MTEQLSGVSFESYKGRTVEAGQHVFVYRNLRNDKWSIKCMDTGLVLGHATNVFLNDCELVVSEAGRQRVLSEKKKNVHAGVNGFYVASLVVDDITLSLANSTSNLREVTYNPYKYDSFVDVVTGDKVNIFDGVYLHHDHKVYGVRG